MYERFTLALAVVLTAMWIPVLAVVAIVLGAVALLAILVDRMYGKVMCPDDYDYYDLF